MRKRSRIYTAAVFLLAACIIFGGWFMTVKILRWQQNKFLNTTGRIEFGAGESALATDNEQNIEKERSVEESEFQGRVMSEELRAIVLAVWKSGSSEVPHEPLPSQMNMEQAIEAGRQWIQNMANQGLYTDKFQEKESDLVKASLCTIDTPLVVSDVEKTIYSYWKVWFFKDNGVSIELTIHAESGEVWMAEISVEIGDEPAETYDLAYLLDYAFPFLETGNTMWVDLEDKVVAESSKSGMITAVARRYAVKVSGEPEKVVMEFRVQCEEKR